VNITITPIPFWNPGYSAVYKHWARASIANEPHARPEKHGAGYGVTARLDKHDPLAPRARCLIDGCLQRGRTVPFVAGTSKLNGLGISTRVVIVDAAKDVAQKHSVTTARIACFMWLREMKS